MDLKSKIILISGPTASGKSQFAIKLAKKINGEIINTDSMQVYKELKILSARPFQKNYKKIRHHLYGFQSVKKNFSTGNWLKLVNQKILDIKKRKKIPIFVGGTGLYFKALTDGLVNIPNIPNKFRKKIRSLHTTLGSKKFYLDLVKMDHLVKNHISPSDTQRAIRAYERGAVQEVKKFIKLKVPNNKTASKAIGINEVIDFINKKISIDEVIERISIKTRQYAKRQNTWGRGNMLDWNRIKPNHLSNFIKKI